ncbi:hypothetical protein ACVWVY_004430 [Bradyrhizobium sp. URHC0002]
MNRLGLRLLLGMAVMLCGQNAIAKNRLTDPIKVARECKTEVELLCKGVRPGGQRMVNCLKNKMAELSTACSSALKSAE